MLYYCSYNISTPFICQLLFVNLLYQCTFLYIGINFKICLVHFSYKRYLENKIRENIDFKGTPIILEFKNKGEN